MWTGALSWWNNTFVDCFSFVKIIIPRISQKSEAMILPAEVTVFASFGTDSSLSVDCFDCSSTSDVRWWTDLCFMHGYASILLHWNTARNCSIVSKRDTHLPHSLPTISVSSHTFSRRSSNTILRIFFAVSGVVTSFDRPLQCSSWQFVRNI